VKEVLNRLLDPSIKWYVYPSLDFQKRIYGSITADNQTLYLCDDALCIPIRFSEYLKWYDPSTGNVGSRVFDKDEAWDHVNESLPVTNQFNGRVAFIPGYRGYLICVMLTDGSNNVEVYVIHRYTDGAVLIYNTGSPTNISVVVNDPPSALGYSVSTNGTRGTGTTTISGGQYVLFYKGTAPGVDASTGLFATSPLGSSKSQPYELYCKSYTGWGLSFPQVYLGIKAPSDMEVLSNYRLIRCLRRTESQPFGGYVNREGVNVSTYLYAYYGGIYLDAYTDDPTGITWDNGEIPFKLYFGWGEDDQGSVKFIIISSIGIKHTLKYVKWCSLFGALIYDVERDEEYQIGGIKPLTNTYSYGAGGQVKNPLIHNFREGDVINALGYIDYNDKLTKTTSPASITWEYINNIYGACHFRSNEITCAEGVGIYTDDPDISISNPKSAFGIARNNTLPCAGLRILPFQDRTLKAGKTYLVITREKEFPPTTSDADLVNWFKSVTPKVLSSSEINGILSVLPGSVWLFGQNTDAVSITAPTSVNPGQSFNVSVSCPTRPNKAVWVALVDANGNVVSSASGTLNSSGNATVSLTAPSTSGTYRIIAIVAGDRTLP